MALIFSLRSIGRECTRSVFPNMKASGISSRLVASCSAIQGIQLKPKEAIMQRACISKTTTLKSAQAEAHGDHVMLWTAERVLAMSLLGVLPAAFIFPSAAMDYALALSLCIHSHWGIEAIVHDYVRPSVFGAVIPKLSVGAVYLLTILTLGGLFYFNYTDVGLVNAIKLLWKL